ncbi:MAG: hypothetical protein WB554_12135 [Desulfomonilaceae bacterium]
MSDEQEYQLYFESIPITVFSNWVSGKELIYSQSEEILLDKSNISDFVIRAVRGMPSELAKGKYCIISGDRDSDPSVRFTKREHFVPEGLGFCWTKFPKGIGTCDKINADFGKHEEQWLRYGTMGMFRPWFVRCGKDGSPEFHAPKKSQHKLSIFNNEEGNPVIAFKGELNLPSEGGPGDLTFSKIGSSEPNSTSVSLALHKMAFLTLWMACPTMIFDFRFDELKNFLKGPNEQTYMPYIEEFLPRANPGVNFSYHVDMIESVTERIGGKGIFDLGDVHVIIKAHHILYGIALIGKMRQPPAEIKARLRNWEPKESVILPLSDFSFGHTGFSKRPVTDKDINLCMKVFGKDKSEVKT